MHICLLARQSGWVVMLIPAKIRPGMNLISVYPPPHPLSPYFPSLFPLLLQPLIVHVCALSKIKCITTSDDELQPQLKQREHKLRIHVGDVVAAACDAENWKRRKYEGLITVLQCGGGVEFCYPSMQRSMHFPCARILPSPLPLPHCCRADAASLPHRRY